MASERCIIGLWQQHQPNHFPTFARLWCQGNVATHAATGATPSYRITLSVSSGCSIKSTPV
jgi:hypothetical protein